jgi:Holliday junction resolvase RusA-like endonuclease
MALRVDVTFYFGTKKSERWGKPHTMKPDRDNCDKLILDEATKAGLFGGDDCRVSAGMIRKYWVNPQGQGAVIEVYEDTSTADINGVEQRELPFEKPGWLISAEGQ